MTDGLRHPNDPDDPRVTYSTTGEAIPELSKRPLSDVTVTFTSKQATFIRQALSFAVNVGPWTFDPEQIEVLVAAVNALGGDEPNELEAIVREVAGGQPVSEHCETCRHWDKVWEGMDYGSNKIPADDLPRWGVCRLIDMPGWGEQTAVAAFVQDGSNYRASLHTRSNFGCSLHVS